MWSRLRTRSGVERSHTVQCVLTRSCEWWPGANECSNDGGVQYVQTEHGLVEVDPTHCPNGHELEGNMSRGWAPCACSADISGHRTWTCQTCKQTTYAPPCLD